MDDQKVPITQYRIHNQTHVQCAKNDDDIFDFANIFRDIS